MKSAEDKLIEILKTQLALLQAEKKHSANKQIKKRKKRKRSKSTATSEPKPDDVVESKPSALKVEKKVVQKAKKKVKKAKKKVASEAKAQSVKKDKRNSRKSIKNKLHQGAKCGPKKKYIITPEMDSIINELAEIKQEFKKKRDELEKMNEKNISIRQGYDLIKVDRGKSSAYAKILAFLLDGNTLNSHQALHKFNVRNISNVIWRLRHLGGWSVKTKELKNNDYCKLQYYLEQ
jgi:hypothetical protein